MSIPRTPPTTPAPYLAQLLALGALAGATIHLTLTLVYAGNWEGDATRGRLALAGVALVLGTALLLVLAQTSRAWPGLLTRLVGMTGAAAAVAVAVLGMLLSSDPGSPDALDTFNTAIVSLTAVVSVVSLLLITASSWQLGMRLSCLPLAALLPAAVVLLQVEVSWSWWLFQFLAAGAVALPALTALTYLQRGRPLVRT